MIKRFLTLFCRLGILLSLLNSFSLMAKLPESDLKLPHADMVNLTTHKKMVSYDKNTLIFELPHYHGALITVDELANNDYLCNYLGADGGIETYTLSTINPFQHLTTPIVKFSFDVRNNFSVKKVKSKTYVSKVICRSTIPMVGYYLQRRNFKSKLGLNQLTDDEKRLPPEEHYLFAARIKFPHQYYQGVRYLLSAKSNPLAVCQLFGMDAPLKPGYQSVVIRSESNRFLSHKRLALTFLNKERDETWKWDLIEDKSYIESIVCQKRPYSRISL